ncbi:hypothetical protein HRAG_02202 [Helicobacter bilis ATCC 43879]|uniref:Uncharacterized protein n=2 Tax=Helicobacter TaxID=209 RepID=C3XJF6_9HELI|nr:outer membrane protein transport protein [Helicobacter bilis]EEO25145.2 hypothetical protein HRAG_02202 [Helicobacter bilis ATCC 43879]
MLRHKRVVGVICGLALSIESMQASGFRLTEQSLNGTALNSAFIAGAYGADSTYYNPANMSLGRDSDKWEFEVNGTLIYIPSFSFDTENRDMGINVEASGLSSLAANGHFCEKDGHSNKVNNKAEPGVPCGAARVGGYATTTLQPVPKFFLKSRAYELPLGMKTNFGFSFTTPSGLAMQWDGVGGGFLKDVSIAMMEFNPVVSIAYDDIFAFGAGVRAIYAFGDFSNTLFVPIKQDVNMGALGNIHSYGTTRVEQVSNASSWGFGYNLAATLQPFARLENNMFQNLRLAVTYRSNVHWDMQGKLSAKSYIYQGVDIPIIGSTKVEGYIGMNADLTLATDLPPIINVALSQDFGNHRVEFVWEHTLWGKAKIFEFGYANQVFDMSNLNVGNLASGQIKPDEMLDAADYSAVAYGNGWKDSSAYRLGYTYFGESYKIMGSIAYDETPAPQGKFGIPDANAYMFGLGFRKRFLDDRLDLGLAYSLALKDNRKSFIVSHDGFGQLHLLTLGAKYLW